MVRIRRALISVSDKTGILDLAKGLNILGVEIISTGGTAQLLRENNIPVKEVSDYTGFPEMLGGRVKTLHPNIHGGILALRDNQEHMRVVKERSIGLIDLVVINLYPFEKAILKPDVTIGEAIENIDIGGPAMLRSAAKNYRFVAVVCNPARYSRIVEELRNNKGCLPASFTAELAIEAYALTGEYDRLIHNYLSGYFNIENKPQKFPGELTLGFQKVQDLRYGENPHQEAAFYKKKGEGSGIAGLKQIQGKALSFNNILDLNSALELVREFRFPAAVIVKHNNPCGVAEDKVLSKAYLNAWKCDKLSAFGGIVALNRKMDIKTARAIAKSGFLECIIAPDFNPQALSLFKEKKNLRILKADCPEAIEKIDFKRVNGGLLLQDKDLSGLDLKSLKVVTKRKPSKKEMESLIFGWIVAKHVKSNAIVLTKGSKTLGIGAGQMSRVDSVMIAKKKAGPLSEGSCLASDAFFPKPDAILWAHKAGVRSIIQPGGSIADRDIINACNKYKIAMVTTSIRHFRH
ncbi:MAG: bifunctional phosphoribosylaminoimidazolecarboxamide formyltransferase/IMP cyclohydrolase [Candidatus Omnitrophota bacterium]|jgi:phosphoribosylaminoimidazolecarboxamide formyltransferase/IMP cyclohydrolase